MLHSMKPLWITLGLIALVVFAAWAAPIARKECEARGGTMIYAGKTMWCHVEER